MSGLKENLRYHALLYILSPILGLIYGIRSGSKTYIRWSIFVFIVLYGSVFTIPMFGGEIGEHKGADGARHWNRVYGHYSNLDFSIWWEELIAIMSFAPMRTTNDDPFIHIISYVTGTIFGSPGLFFVAVAIVYGYFCSGALVKILSYVDWKSKFNKNYLYFFLLIFVLWKAPSDMQTVRTWTGMWVLIYAVISYYETKNKKYLLLAFVPPFIHVAYLAMALPVWFVMFSGFRNPKVYFIIFIFSMLVSGITEQTGVLDNISKTELGASKTKAYYVDNERSEVMEKGLEKKTSATNFYKTYEQYLIHFKVLSGLIIYLFILINKEEFTKFENTLFSYGLAMAAFANFFTAIFALHNRSWSIAGIFILALLVIFISKKDLGRNKITSLKVKFPLFLFAVAFIPLLVFFISSFLNFTSFNVLILPIISWIEPEVSTSLRDVIVMFL